MLQQDQEPMPAKTSFGRAWEVIARILDPSASLRTLLAEDGLAIGRDLSSSGFRDWCQGESF